MIYSVHILQCNSKSIWSWPVRKLIQYVTGKNYSHYAILVTDGYNSSFVYESTWPKSKKTNYLTWKRNHSIVKDYILKSEHDPKVYLDAMVGIKYSIWQLCLIYLQVVFNSWGMVLRFKSNNGKNSLICSELAGLYLINYHNVAFDEYSDTLGLDEIEQKLNELIKEG